MYLNGEGTTVNLLKAYGWLSVSNANGSKSAGELLTELSMKMPPEQIAEGQVLTSLILKRVKANKNLFIPKIRESHPHVDKVNNSKNTDTNC